MRSNDEKCIINNYKKIIGELIIIISLTSNIVTLFGKFEYYYRKTGSKKPKTYSKKNEPIFRSKIDHAMLYIEKTAILVLVKI